MFNYFIYTFSHATQYPLKKRDVSTIRIKKDKIKIIALNNFGSPLTHKDAAKKDGKKTLYTKGHIHAMAKRRTVKLFLSHFWLEWRKLEGLPISEPFAHRGLANPSK